MAIKNVWIYVFVKHEFLHQNKLYEKKKQKPH